MKVRKAKKSTNSKRRAREAARQDAEIADLKTQLDNALALVDTQAACSHLAPRAWFLMDNALALADGTGCSTRKRIVQGKKGFVQLLQAAFQRQRKSQESG